MRDFAHLSVTAPEEASILNSPEAAIVVVQLFLSGVTKMKLCGDNDRRNV